MAICSSRDPKYICFRASFSKNMFYDDKNGMSYITHNAKHIISGDVYVSDWCQVRWSGCDTTEIMIPRKSLWVSLFHRCLSHIEIFATKKGLFYKYDALLYRYRHREMKSVHRGEK